MVAWRPRGGDHRRPADSACSCSITVSHLDLDGEPCLIGHIHDITARRILEEQLRESEELFRLLAEYSTDVIGRLSGDGRIEYVSPASNSVYGYPPTPWSAASASSSSIPTTSRR